MKALLGFLRHLINIHHKLLKTGCVFACVGRALEWHSRGQEFDPLRLHHKNSEVIKPRSFIFLYSHAALSIYTINCSRLNEKIIVIFLLLTLTPGLLFSYQMTPYHH